MVDKQKILVLGSTGMLGHQVVNYLTTFASLDVFDMSYRSKLRKNTIVMDVMDANVLEKEISSIKPDFIVNCIGVLIKGSKNEANAIYLNSYLPHRLKDLAEEFNSKLIHISTDCVFSGKIGQYVETDHRDGEGVYSKTKTLGEVIDDHNLTIRTSIIGPELKANGEGLFDWFMRQDKIVSGYTEHVWSGVTTLELAKSIKWSIDHDLTGLYHITNNLSITKYNLLKLFNKHTGKSIQIEPVSGTKVDKSFVDTRLCLDYDIPSYDEMVFDMIFNMEHGSNQYRNYKGKYL